MFNKLINWIFYQIKLKQEIANKKYRDEFNRLVAEVKKTAKTEVAKRCECKNLNKLYNTYYQCPDCKRITRLDDCPIFEEKLFKKHIGELSEALGIKQILNNSKKRRNEKR